MSTNANGAETDGEQAHTETVTWNGREYDADTFAHATRLAINSADIHGNGTPGLRHPEDLASYFGRQYGNDRDIFDVLGYPKEIDLEDYRAKYERHDIAERIVRLPARDTWQQPPALVDEEETETAFETAVEEFAKATRMWHYLRRTDTVAGIGEYGVLFIGFTDGNDLAE